VSLYIEIPVMIVMYIGYLIVRRISAQDSNGVLDPGLKGFTDLVDVDTVDLRKNEHEEGADEHQDEAEREKRLQRGALRILWRVYYSIA
jgi:AAT family amino acid transporter